MIKTIAIANAIITIVLVAIIATGRFGGHTVSAAETSEVIRTKRLEVVDSGGKVKAVVGTEQNGSGVPKVILYDENGKEAAFLTLNSQGLGTMYFQSKETEGKVSVGYLWGSDTTSGNERDPLGSWGIRVRGSNGQQNSFGLLNDGHSLTKLSRCCPK